MQLKLLSCTFLAGLLLTSPAHAQSNLQPDSEQKDGQPPNVQLLPKECTEQVSPDTGEPVMFPHRGPLIWGLSAKPAIVGKETLVILWLYNSTDRPQSVSTCGDIEIFWDSEIDVFDASGKRVLSRREVDLKRRVSQKEPENQQERKRREFKQCVGECYRNMAIEIPPHSCVRGNVSERPRDFSRDLSAYYELGPGDYFVAPGERGHDCLPVDRKLGDSGARLKLTVQEK